MRSRPLRWAGALLLLMSACTVTEGDLLKTVPPDLMLVDDSLPPLCTTDLLSAASCTTESDLTLQADQSCAARGLVRVDLSLMAGGCASGSARSATATCCPFSRPAHCTLEQQRPADKVCRSGLDLIGLADSACAVVGRRALIDDLLDFCQNGTWLGVRYWCCL